MSSVPATVTRAINSSTGRSGVSAGRVSAAASVTTPRMPAHAMIAASGHDKERCRRLRKGRTAIT